MFFPQAGGAGTIEAGVVEAGSGVSVDWNESLSINARTNAVLGGAGTQAEHCAAVTQRPT